MQIVLPKHLTFEDLLTLDVTISISAIQNIQCSCPLSIAQLNEFLETQSPVNEGQYYPVKFVKRFLLIKLNSLLRSEANVPSQFLFQLVKVFNNCELTKIFVSHSEVQIFSQIIRSLEGSFSLSSHDLDNILEGTALLTTIGVWMSEECDQFLKKDQYSFALSFVALGGRNKAFTPIVHQEKNHTGQAHFAQRISNLVKKQNICSSGVQELKVQDPYSMRCAPHVHGVAYDSLTNLKKSVLSFANRLHCKWINIKGQHFPNLLRQSDTLSLKMDYVLLSLQEIGAQSFLRSERILNSYLGNNNINQQELPYKSLKALLKQGIQLTSRNKILCQMGNYDTMNLSNYEDDVFFTSGSYFRKANQLMGNLYLIITLQILSSLLALESIYQQNQQFQKNPQAIFECLQMKQNYKFLKQNISPLHKNQALMIIKNKWTSLS